ncbi:MAG: dTDP-4-dehydrorhamnose 3,5-epimerase [Acidobacteria bacterium]|nr:dTDP-4-dehydrorhamnose 3,5-epimerase [Acidobacteriota bacterium]
MKLQTTALPGVVLLEPVIHADSRGFFMETWHRLTFAGLGLDVTFVQDNLAESRPHVLRGLHYQYPRQQGKLVQTLRGEIFDVAVDIRTGSPTFGKWEAFRLSAQNRRLLYIPEGFAHGYCVLGDTALVSYKCTEFYAPGDEGGIVWNDPALAIQWPIRQSFLSAKDQNLPRLRDIPADRLPRFPATG